MPILHLDDALASTAFAGTTLEQHLAQLVPLGATLDARWPSVPRQALQHMVAIGGHLSLGELVIASCDAHLGAVGEATPCGELHRSDSPWTVHQASQVVMARRLRAHIEAGVQIVDARRTIVGPQVTIEAGAILWPDCTLLGKTKISAGAQILSGCWFMDTTIGERAVIKPHSVCTQAQVGPDCQVGPMAHLRPGTVLLKAAKVGNFVEVKKSTLGEGAKASHLTYLGDSTVGAGANVGAGTITCNYDGFGKHHTHIGAGAFIGSNSALVAPVRIGDGAIVGAGSTVAADVPDNALVIERAELRVLKGYAKRLNARNQAAAVKAKAAKSS